MFGIDPRIDIAQTANAEFSWLIFARRLVQSAYLLDKHSETGELYKDVRNVARMCAGMAIECYLKAYFVADGNHLHDGEKQKTFGAHDLPAMAKAVDFVVTPEQERVLYYLSMWVRVKGRFPVPLKPQDMKIHPDDAVSYPYEEYRLVWDETSDDVCMDIIREAEARIVKKRADKPNTPP